MQGWGQWRIQKSKIGLIFPPLFEEEWQEAKIHEV